VGVGFAMPKEQGIHLGAQVVFNSRQDEGSVSGQNAGQVLETYRSMEITPRLVLALSEKMRLGIKLRYKSIDSYIAGAFGVDDDDKTRYSGVLYGFGLGGTFVHKNITIGLSYASALSGKATAISESKVLSESGVGILDGIVQANSKTRVGLSIKRWFAVRDDRQKPTTSREGNNILLAGTDYKHRIYPVHEIGGGAYFLAWSDIHARTAVYYKQLEFMESPDDLPGQGQNSQNRFEILRLIGSLVVPTPQGQVEFGLSLSSSNNKTNSNQGSGRELSAKEYGLFTAIGIGL
jgi:hypothetical protein